jgi:predicted lipid-binding transport protein (Tim44 family)
MQNFLKKLIPFLFLGFMIVVLVGGLILLSYLLMFGLILGVILFCVSWLKTRLFASKEMTIKEPPKTGRTFDHDELK